MCTEIGAQRGSMIPPEPAIERAQTRRRSADAVSMRRARRQRLGMSASCRRRHRRSRHDMAHAWPDASASRDVLTTRPSSRDQARCASQRLTRAASSEPIAPRWPAVQPHRALRNARRDRAGGRVEGVDVAGRRDRSSESCMARRSSATSTANVSSRPNTNPEQLTMPHPLTSAHRHGTARPTIRAGPASASR